MCYSCRMATEKHARFAEAVATELRAERAVQQMSLDVLAEKTGINKGTLHKYLSGKRVLPISTLHAISEGLGVDALIIAARAQKRME